MRFQNSPQTRRWEGFLVFGNFSSLDSLPGMDLHPCFVSLFIFYILSYLLSKTMGCFSGCLMSSASIQKLFCGICSALKCSFDEFVGEKVVSPSYSSAISGPPPPIFLKRALVFPLLLFSSISLHWLLRKSFLSLLVKGMANQFSILAVLVGAQYTTWD